MYELKGEDTVRLKEFDIYGSSRVGILTEDPLVGCAGCTTATCTGSASLWTGRKLYELTNHLGNVLSTITDMKIYYDADTDSIADFSIPEIASQQDYYPFGMPMPGRSLSLSNYRFGFNGKENDDEVKGFGNSIDFGARIYDPRLGGWLSVDPLFIKYPYISNYSFANDNPILNIDIEGKVVEPWWIKDDKGKYINFQSNSAFGEFASSFLKLNKTNDVFRSVYSDLVRSREHYNIRQSGYENWNTDGAYSNKEVKFYNNGTGTFDSPTVFEEVFHAGQDDFYKGEGLARNKFQNEVEAKVAAIVTNCIGNDKAIKGTEDYSKIKEYYDQLSNGKTPDKKLKNEYDKQLNDLAKSVKNTYGSDQSLLDEFIKNKGNTLKYVETKIKHKK